MVEPILEQGVGWGIILGFGGFFAIVMSLLTLAQKRYLREFQTSEMFMTAHRSVRTGLVASAIVSAWTWAATLLQSSTVAYQYGVSGPFWYASGATIQVLLFAILAIELKRKAPHAHTLFEIINARYGKPAHIVFLFFGLATNMVVTAMLLLGGSAVVNALTGVNTIASCFLLPLGVLIYTLFGGIKATFLTDYVHTTVIFIVLLSFLFTVYCTSPEIGSPDRMYDLLTAASQKKPVIDNAEGSYLTMSSLQGLVFGIINIVGNFGTVFVDNAYWQRAIAAKPSSTVHAYLIGGLAWFAIPFTLATTMGLSGVAVLDYVDPKDVSAGLVLPLAATHLLGKAGGFAALVLVFMAVTSASSAELIAVSSIYTYDIYRTYIHPDAMGSQVINHSHLSVIGFGIIMGALATILNYIGISLGYMYLLMGIISSPAVFPVAFTITWKKQSALAAIVSSIVGLICGLIAWLVTAQKLYGEITLATTGDNYPMLAGNLVSILVPLIITVVWSFAFPDDFDFDITRTKLQILTDDEVDENYRNVDDSETDPNKLKKAFKFALWSSIILTLILAIIWPLPMYFSRYVFSKPFFTFWVAISMIWAICGAVAVAIFPVVEARDSVFKVIKGVFSDICGKRKEIEKEEVDVKHDSTNNVTNNEKV